VNNSLLQECSSFKGSLESLALLCHKRQALPEVARTRVEVRSTLRLFGPTWPGASSGIGQSLNFMTQ